MKLKQLIQYSNKAKEALSQLTVLANKVTALLTEKSPKQPTKSAPSKKK